MTILATAYSAVARARRRSYERHPDRQRCLREPVISIGNISVGGSGKTPAVAHIATLLMAAGERPAILTRGYGRREPTEGALVVSDGRHILADVARAGDEPLMLARALPGAVVVVGADRYLSGVIAERRFRCSVHLLDDGFQHVQLRRDVDIVLVAPEDLRGRVMPDGRLREGLAALSTADALVVNANEEVDVRAIAETTGVSTIFRATTRLSGSGLPLRVGSPRGDPTPGGRPGSVLAVAAIARPRRFFDMLASSGWDIAREMTFRDHHWFTRAELDRIVGAARDAGARAIVTTEKDLMRLLPLRPFGMPIVAAPLELMIEPGCAVTSDGRTMGAAADAGAASAPSDPASGLAFSDWLTGRLGAARAAGARPGGVEQPA